MKSKIYLKDCIVEDLNWWLISFIIYDKSTFNTNGG